jgi:hypothetical protein
MFKPVTVEELETTLQQAQRHRQATNENGPA